MDFPMAYAPNTAGRPKSCTLPGAAAIALALALAAPQASADEADAKALLKAMSDYMAAQQQFSFTYDTTFEVVTQDHQKLQVAASGAMTVQRPDKLRATRQGGFANVEMVFDGKTFTILGKDANVYVQAELPGTIDELVDAVREKLHKGVPGADLLLANVYDTLMEGVVDVKDLGSGVIGGVECDHLAFRTAELDWQIWIAQGAAPYPCRYVITSTQVEQAPQYTLQLDDWKGGADVAATDFGFQPPTGAKQLDPSDLKALEGLGDMPSNFSIGGAQ